MTIFVWLLGAALSASAHDLYPIRPVRATLRVEPDRIVADLRADSIVWIEEVTGLHPMPARYWPTETLAKVEDYTNAHFQLTTNGARLEGKLVEARYRQFPWEVNEEGTFFLRLVYDTTGGAGKSISATARFYEEYREEIQSELDGRPLPYHEGYRTFVSIPGRRHLTFTLTPDAPSFTAMTAEARRTALASMLEAFGRGAKTVLSSAEALPALLALVLCLGLEPLSRAFAGALLTVASLGFIAGTSAGVPPWTPWAATLGASLIIGRLNGKPRDALALLAAAALTAFWGATAQPFLPHFALSGPAALAGTLVSGTVLFAVVRLGIRAQRRQLLEISHSRVDVLFARRARLTATALAMVGAYGLWQSLQR